VEPGPAVSLDAGSGDERPFTKENRMITQAKVQRMKYLYAAYTTAALYKHGVKCYRRLEKRMISNGGLTFGWDMRTARMIFPHAFNAFHRTKMELTLRLLELGLTFGEFYDLNIKKK
jgi:hypothetical protein